MLSYDCLTRTVTSHAKTYGIQVIVTWLRCAYLVNPSLTKLRVQNYLHQKC